MEKPLEGSYFRFENLDNYQTGIHDYFAFLNLDMESFTQLHGN